MKKEFYVFKKIIELFVVECLSTNISITLDQSPKSETVYIYIHYTDKEYCKIRLSTHEIDTVNYHYQIIYNEKTDPKKIVEEYYDFHENNHKNISYDSTIY